jgi:GTP 3',8-cyclase
LRHFSLLKLQDIIEIARVATSYGIRKIRITGGEPLLRDDLEELIVGLVSLPDNPEICMTTNGSLLTKRKAVQLRRCGLARVNISLDTINPNQFKKITGGGNIDDVHRGIEAARFAGFQLIKINMVVNDGTKQNIEAMREFCLEQGLELQTIRQFSLATLPCQHHIWNRPLPCEKCNRIRLTADGYLKPCLFSNTEIKVDLKNIPLAIMRAIAEKPLNGRTCDNRVMSQIGG